MRAAAYVRISNDPEGKRAGVDRQHDDVVATIEGRGWEHLATFEDNDVSASNGAVRAGYRDLMAAVVAGEVDRVVVWHSSRLWRRRTERAEAIGALKDAGVSVVAVRGPDLDLSTAYGRGMAGLLGEFDTMEAEVNSERVSAWHAQRAQQGAPPSAGTRPFGYARHREGPGPMVWSVDPDEGPVVAEAYARILAGETVTSLRNDLNRRGVTTSAGKAWTTTSLTRVLMSPTVAALRRLEDGTLVEGVWPACVDRTTWERVQAVLETRKRSGRRESTRYLLTGGLAVCGVCTLPMHGHAKAGRRRYECRPQSDGRSFAGCGLSIAADPAEEFVAEMALAAVDADMLGRLLAERRPGRDDGIVERLRVLEDELALIADDYADGLLSRRAYLAAASRLETRAETLRGELRTSDAPDVLEGLSGDPDALRARWDAASVPWRRRFTAALLERVEVAPAKHRGGRFDPDRIRPTWRV